MRKAKKKSHKASVPFEPFLLKNLKDSKFAAAYLTECIHLARTDDDMTLFFHALMQIAKAQGMSALAKKIKKTRDTLYKALKHKNPKLDTFTDLIDAMDMEISFTPKKREAQASA